MCTRRIGGEKQILESLTDPLLCGETMDIFGVCAQYIDELEGLPEFTKGLGLKLVP
jgi:hypothetical protein